jgi:hypothetical protein
MLERPAKRLDVHQTPDPTYYAPGKEGRLNRLFPIAAFLFVFLGAAVVCGAGPVQRTSLEVETCRIKIANKLMKPI